jgi:L-rhamnose mutarotase
MAGREATVGFRRIFALDLHEDAALIAQYRAWHRPGAVPPAVIDSILASGVKIMEIYLTGNRLFMITEGEQEVPAADRGQAGTNSEREAWETLMWTFQKPLPWSRPGEKWIEAECIFRLDRDAPSSPKPSHAVPV